LTPRNDLRGLRAGVPVALLTGLEPDVEAAFHRGLAALKERGVEVREVDLPLGSRWTALVSSITMHAEAAAVHARWLAERASDYGADVLARLLAGACLATAEYARVQAVRDAVRAELLHVLAGVDVLIAPATPAPAPVLQPGAYVPGDAPFGTAPSAFQLQRLFSLTGVPAASAPCGLDSRGLPVGVQIAGRPWDEASVLGFAQAVMEAANPPAVAPLGE
jgi:aspartyl-tRNA(Asn)/glutamyl-tRNA(Gln) amidotransferase subunit A